MKHSLKSRKHAWCRRRRYKQTLRYRQAINRHAQRPTEPISRASMTRSKRLIHFAIFPHRSKVFSRDAWLAELFNRRYLQPKPSSDKLYVCVKVSTKTNSVRLNFHHWCKTPSSAFSKKNFRDDPQFFARFPQSPQCLQLCFVQLITIAPSARYSTFKYPVTLKPGQGSLKVIENYTNRSGTHDFLLTFHSHHRPISHRFRDIGHFRRKSPIFPTPCIKRPRRRGSPWNFVSAQGLKKLE